MTDVVIIGAGGFAREAYFAFLQCNEEAKKWNVLGFIDENPRNHDITLCDLSVLGGFDWLEKHRTPGLQALCAVGNPRTRKLLADKTATLGVGFCTVIHPDVRISRWVEIGPGTFIAAGNLLTTQVRLGAHVLIDQACTVAHDCVIESFCTIHPGSHISGNVHLHQGVEFGTGAVIIQGITVGEWSVIGAGAAVTADIPAHVTAVGVPCRVIKEHATAAGVAR